MDIKNDVMTMTTGAKTRKNEKITATVVRKPGYAYVPFAVFNKISDWEIELEEAYNGSVGDGMASNVSGIKLRPKDDEKIRVLDRNGDEFGISGYSIEIIRHGKTASSLSLVKSQNAEAWVYLDDRRIEGALTMLYLSEAKDVSEKCVMDVTMDVDAGTVSFAKAKEKKTSRKHRAPMSSRELYVASEAGKLPDGHNVKKYGKAEDPSGIRGKFTDTRRPERKTFG